jgi:hypothetical protein
VKRDIALTCRFNLSIEIETNWGEGNRSMGRPVAQSASLEFALVTHHL